METQFKVFDSDWGYSSIEDSIKEYQEKHNVEIRNIISIRDKPCEIVVGVVFEKHRNYFSSSKHAITAFAPPEGSK